MKHLLLTTIAALLLVVCGNPEADSALPKAAKNGNTETVTTFGLWCGCECEG